MTLSYSKPPRRSPHSLELTPESSRVLFCDLTTAFSFALSSYCFCPLPPSAPAPPGPWPCSHSPNTQWFPHSSSLPILFPCLQCSSPLATGHVLISDLHSCRFLKASPYDSVQKCCPYSPFTSFPSPHKPSQALILLYFLHGTL